ncbi:hypothetical protein D3C71_1351800 [compost metagenome]
MLVDLDVTIEQAIRRAAGVPLLIARNEDRSPLIILDLANHLQHVVVEHPLRAQAVRRVHAVLDVYQVVVGDNRNCRDGADLADAGGGNHAHGAGRAGTDRVVAVGHATEAGVQALGDEALDVGRAVLQQFPGHGHNLGAELVDLQALRAEAYVLVGRRLVFGDDLAFFVRAVAGGVLHGLAARGANDLGDLPHTAECLQRIQDGTGHGGGHGVATLLRVDRRIAAHGAANLRPVFGAQRVVTTAAPLVEQCHVGAALALGAGTGIMFTHASVMQVAFGRQVHHLLMALDGGVDTVDFSRVVVVLLLVVGVPVGAGVVVQQGAGFLGQRVAALPLGLKIESHI